jgi:hypothetical protein
VHDRLTAKDGFEIIGVVVYDLNRETRQHHSRVLIARSPIMEAEDGK